MTRYTLIDPTGKIVDQRYGGRPALTAKLDRLNKTRPGHRLVTDFGSTVREPAR